VGPPAAGSLLRGAGERGAKLRHLALERRDLARLRLQGSDGHARVAVEVDAVVADVDRRARLHVLDAEAEEKQGTPRI
jgi:hypothetical protein